MALHGLVVYRIIGPCGLAVVSMHMDIASMVLAVRAGCAPRWPNPPRPGYMAMRWTSLMCGHAFLCPCDWFAFATCGVSPCHNGNGHE